MFKRYASETSAKAAVTRAGLHLMTVDYEVVHTNGNRLIEPLIITSSIADMNEIHNRGFNARVDRSRAVLEDE